VGKGLIISKKIGIICNGDDRVDKGPTDSRQVQFPELAKTGKAKQMPTLIFNPL